MNPVRRFRFHTLLNYAALTVTVLILFPVTVSGVALQGSRRSIARVGLSWIAENVIVRDPDPVVKNSPVLVSGEDIIGYFKRVGPIQSGNGAPALSRQSAAKFITEYWEKLKDDITSVSVVTLDKAFIDKDNGELVVDRLSVKITRYNRTFQGIAFIIKRGDIFVIAVFVTENRAAVINNMIKTLEQVSLPKDRTGGNQP